MEKTDNEINRSFLDLLNIMVSLRDPVNGCKWDISQDSHTLKKYCLEEAYEVVDAIENNNTEGLCEELGDLLFQVIFHAEINKEKGYFDIHDVINNLSKKMIRRHPHVFQENSEQNSLDEIGKNWIKIKEKERINKGAKGMFDDIPMAFPAMMRSLKLQKRASENGFDWEKAIDAYEKISEEKLELEAAMTKGSNLEIEEEVGDLIFSVINFARKLKIDPENALRLTNKKFLERINYIENELMKEGKQFSETSLEELEEFWVNAKKEIKQAKSLK